DDLADDFHLEALPEQDKSAGGTWEFVYKLRPKRADVKAIPNLTLVYYDPASRTFRTDIADEIAIKVTPPPDKALAGLKVLGLRARVHQRRRPEEVVRADPHWPRPGPGLLAALLALPPLGCFVWYRVWRRLNPNVAERRLRRRSRAARLALHYLEKQAGDDVE